MPCPVQAAHGQGHEKKLACLLVNLALNGEGAQAPSLSGFRRLVSRSETSSDDNFRHFRWSSRERRRCEITRADESGSCRWTLYNDADLTKVQASMFFTQSVIRREI